MAKDARGVVTKSALTPEGWRARFKPVYEGDQCLPGAFYAILTSADLLLGTKVTAAHTLGDINRKVGYRKGRATPAEALEKKAIRRWLSGFGLEAFWERISPNAFDHLEQSTRQDDVSFSLVDVDLQLVLDYDPNARIKGPPFPTDHAVVVLKVDAEYVEFFDPTFNASLPANAGIRPRVSTPSFVRRWSESRDPYYRVWLRRPGMRIRGRTEREGLIGVRPLSTFRQKGRGGER